MMGNGLLGSPHLRVISSVLRPPIFNLLAQLPIFSLQKRQFFKSLSSHLRFLLSYNLSSSQGLIFKFPENLVIHPPII